MCDSRGTPDPCGPRGDGTAQGTDPATDGASRPSSAWIEHVSDQRWGLLVSHARVRLFEDLEEAEDLVQTVLAEAADGCFDSVEVTAEKLLPFLKAVIEKRALKVHRSRRRREQRERHGESSFPSGEGAVAFREASRIWLRRDLASALRALPKDQRRSVVWKDLQGRTTPEIAHLEGVTEAAVRQRLARGRAALRPLLGDRKLLQG